VTIAAETHVGMTWIPGGSFLMGSAEFYPEEAPVRRVKVEGFWIDERLVTVAEFRRFGRRPAMAWFSGLLKARSRHRRDCQRRRLCTGSVPRPAVSGCGLALRRLGGQRCGARA
jgi:formylglycine-generating enzyme required for sulfatase activity